MLHAVDNRGTPRCVSEERTRAVTASGTKTERRCRRGGARASTTAGQAGAQVRGEVRGRRVEQEGRTWGRGAARRGGKKAKRHAARGGRAGARRGLSAKRAHCSCSCTSSQRRRRRGEPQRYLDTGSRTGARERGRRGVRGGGTNRGRGAVSRLTSGREQPSQFLGRGTQGGRPRQRVAHTALIRMVYLCATQSTDVKRWRR